MWKISKLNCRPQSKKRKHGKLPLSNKLNIFDSMLARRVCCGKIRIVWLSHGGGGSNAREI